MRGLALGLGLIIGRSPLASLLAQFGVRWGDDRAVWGDDEVIWR